MRRLFAIVLLLVAALAAGVADWFYGRLRASLPQLDGTAQIAGLSAPVAVERDALGVPAIAGSTRADLARALGFLHAQDRFFQMDLMRRRAAGELAELFGKAALPIDRADRGHGFRALAVKVVAEASPEQRALLEAYAAGVNAGLSALRARPFEYYVLRAHPQPWKPEDSVLVAYSMMLTLQGGGGGYELSLGTLRDTYGSKAVEFFAPLSGPSDAALDGTTAPLPPIPGPQIIDLRKETGGSSSGTRQRFGSIPKAWRLPLRDLSTPGSNAFAVAGSRTATGAALVANDMHLDLAVPNIWYRASLRLPGLTLTGVTLPGSPLIIAGSNGHIAWGFTNAPADTSDLVVVTPTASPDLYVAPDNRGLLDFEHRREMIRVKGAPSVSVDYLWTIYGPIVGHNAQGRPLALHWTAYDSRANDCKLIELETATTTAEAVAIAHRLGVPTLNFVVADTSGHIAWTIAGRLPKRIGYDGRFPVSWDFGDRRWDGFVDPDKVPVVADPKEGFLWSANARPLGGAAMRLIGDGGYEAPARAAQIRGDLARLAAPVRPSDLLSIELDDRADFLSRWREFLLRILSPEVAAKNESRARLRAAIETWSGRADAGSAAYRLVRLFHTALSERVLGPIFAPCRETDPGFDWHLFHTDDALWAIIHARPRHLLSPAFPTWDALLLAAADDVVRTVRDQGLSPSDATWGKRNTLHMIHPFAHVLPAWLTRWLNMPAEPLPGDSDMPRVQSPTFGASERFVVSPGHESEGIFEMPGGQSGHPLSPFYRAGHEAWVRGDPAPFLPGPPVHRLSLTP